MAKARKKSQTAREASPIGASHSAATIGSMVGLIALTIIVYSNSLYGRFVFDDQQIVFQNPQLMNVRTFGDVIAFGSGWRQLLFLTYGLNYYWTGLNTVSYHAFNIGLHAANVLLVYWIIRTLMKHDEHVRFVALAGAAVFCVHTLFSSAVSYIAGRSSVLCGTFYFAAVLLFLKALQERRLRFRIVYFVLTGMTGLLAWQAKQEAITLPLLLAAIVFLHSEKKNWRWIAPLILVPAVIIILIRDQLAALYASVGGNQILVSAGFEKVLTPALYFRTYLTSVVGYYLPRFVVPASLSADPQITPVEHWYSPEFLVSLIVLAALAWVILRFSNSQRLLSVGLAALFVSPLMAYSAIPLADVVLEHRAYIPGLGVAIVFAWAFYWLSLHYSEIRWLAFGALIVLFGFMTGSRNAVWANNVSLWEDAEKKGPQKPRTHFNLGQAYQETKRLPEAIREYEHALALKADIHAAYSNMAAIYLDQNQYDKGEEMLRKVTSMAPDFTEAFINLGVLYLRKQQPDQALIALDRALAINPQSFAAHFNKGEALTLKGDFKAAVESYEEAVHLRPDIEAFRVTLDRAKQRLELLH